MLLIYKRGGKIRHQINDTLTFTIKKKVKIYEVYMVLCNALYE